MLGVQTSSVLTCLYSSLNECKVLLINRRSFFLRLCLYLYNALIVGGMFVGKDLFFTADFVIFVIGYSKFIISSLISALQMFVESFPIYFLKFYVIILDGFNLRHRSVDLNL